MTTNSARRTVSFYRYVKLEEPEVLRQGLSEEWALMGVLGRVYLASEGINAQVSVPALALETFQAHVRSIFPDIPFKIALEEQGEAFVKLKVKVRSKLVSDGLVDSTFDSSQVGEHLDAKAFNEALQEGDALLVDMRNHYESEVGRFDGAFCPEANTFREALPEVAEKLSDHKDRKILLYCTGGIRCEKASAWLRHQGFKEVKQLYGGIIAYAQQVKAEGLPNRFMGKNFVFDQRMGERVTSEIIAQCHQCLESCDTHHNCAYEGCNRLFIQCPNCREEFNACCSRVCQEIAAKPKEERVKIQQDWEERLGPKHYRSRTRLPREYALREPTRLDPLPLENVEL